MKQNKIFTEWVRKNNLSIINYDTLARFIKESYECSGCGVRHPLEDTHYESTDGRFMCQECGWELEAPNYLANDEFNLVFHNGDDELWKQV